MAAPSEVPTGTAPSSGGPAPAGGRILFIDLARAIAVLLMVQGHTIDALLAPDYRTSLQYNAWLYLRGLTSCTFLFLSGAAFSLTALRHWDDQRRFSRRALKRIRRLVFFLALGYFVKFPMGKFAHLSYATDERWRSFLAVDVLQNVALTLLVLQALIWATRTPRAFATVCAWVAGLIVGLTPVVHGIDFRHYLPLGLAAYMTHATGSLFPLFPWAGFTLLGATFGVTAGAVGDPRPPAAAGPRAVPRRRGTRHRCRPARRVPAGSTTACTTGGAPVRCRSCSGSDRCCSCSRSSPASATT